MSNSTMVHVILDPEDGPQLSNQADACLNLAELALERFIAKNAGYGKTSFLFGGKGQVQDMYRKVMKLKRLLWDEIEDPAGEPPSEIIEDLIGHCLLTLYFLQHSELVPGEEKG
jgi:hypothetical protein